MNASAGEAIHDLTDLDPLPAPVLDSPCFPARLRRHDPAHAASLRRSLTRTHRWRIHEPLSALTRAGRRRRLIVAERLCASAHAGGRARARSRPGSPPATLHGPGCWRAVAQPLAAPRLSDRMAAVVDDGAGRAQQGDDMVRTEPKKFSTLQMVASIAAGNHGEETFEGYHEKYVDALIVPFYDIYFSNSSYFYNAHSLKDKTTWRELAGIHVEYALPEGKLDPVEATNYTRKTIQDTFFIGNTHFPTAWTRDIPPDVHVTMGGPNAGFTSLAAALDYLQAHPTETVWVMNWDAPSRPKDDQLNENMVLLVLAGPGYKTERDALAWIGYPASAAVADFQLQKGLPSRANQAWKATLDGATHNGRKDNLDIGYVIHDANITD